ncbi:MAG: pilus assembly protein PilM [Chloroflexi bacterium]|nr:pilus assembly protein PilM [Chloroflexota bacterium]
MQSREVITLDVEGSSIRLLTAKNGAVEKFELDDLSPGQVKDGLIMDPAGVGVVINGLFAKAGVPKQRVITCMTGLRAIPRRLTLPKLPNNVLEGAIRREARREMPLSPDELYLSWQILEDKGTNLDIYLLGVPRDLLDSQIQALRAAGIKPQVMDLKPFALIRAVNEKDVAIGDLETDSLDVMIVVNDVPQIMRTIALGEEDTLDKAQRLAEELRRTIKFHNDNQQDLALPDDAPVVLTGSLTNDPTLFNIVQSQMEHPVKVPEPPLRIPPGFPVATFMVNIGLALK